jgi:hypothetical protein
VVPKIEKLTDEDFVKSIIENLKKKNAIVISISKEGAGYKVDEIKLTSKRDLRKYLNRAEDFWNDVAHG